MLGWRMRRMRKVGGGRRDADDGDLSYDRARYRVGRTSKSSYYAAYPAYGLAYPPRHPLPRPGPRYANANAYASYPSPSPGYDNNNDGSAGGDDGRRRIENWLQTSRNRTLRGAGSAGGLGSGSASDYTQSPWTPSWHLGDSEYAYGHDSGYGYEHDSGYSSGYGEGGGYREGYAYGRGGSAPTSPSISIGRIRIRIPNLGIPQYDTYLQQYSTYPQIESPLELGDEFVSFPPTMTKARSYAPSEGYAYYRMRGGGSASDYTLSPRTPSWHLGDSAYGYGRGGGDGYGVGYGGRERYGYGGGGRYGGSAPTSPTVPMAYHGYDHGFGFGFGFQDGDESGDDENGGGYAARFRSEGYAYPLSGYPPSYPGPGHGPQLGRFERFERHPHFESPSELGDEFVSLPPTTPSPSLPMRQPQGMRGARPYASPEGYGHDDRDRRAMWGYGDAAGMRPTPITITSQTTAYPPSSTDPTVGPGVGLGLDTSPSPSTSMRLGEARERRSRSSVDLRGAARDGGARDFARSGGRGGDARATTSGMTMGMTGQRPRVDRSNTASSMSALRSSESTSTAGTAKSPSSDATISALRQRNQDPRSRNPRGPDQRDPEPFIHTALGWWPEKPLPHPSVRWYLSAAFPSPRFSSRRAAPSAYGYDNADTLANFLRQIPSAELDESPFTPPLERVRLVVKEECGWVFDLHASSIADSHGAGEGRRGPGRRRRKHFTFATLCEAIASLMHRPVPRGMYESARTPAGNAEGEGIVRLLEGWRRRVRAGVFAPGPITGPSAPYMPGVNPGDAHGGETRFLVMDMLGRERTFWGLVVGESSGEWVLKTCV
ncbi:hypothetical protein BD410DRAFT_837573 [Rickenella mellea]|uniref:Uncharacterized protein n=1 Tax=Rickenella mellea TaxID=50990 RepID=A0A4Y7QE88_9AGAM|nr:hypothetical protein BD410DRAFT_837573 [Rickenella mellea]